MNHVDELERLKRRVEIRDEVIKDFKAIERKETNRLHKIIDELKDTIEDLKAEIAEKDAQIKKLKDSYYFLMKTNELRSTINQQRAEIGELKNKLNALPDNFWDVVSQKDETIRRQKTLIDELKYELSTSDNFWDAVNQKDEIIKQLRAGINELNSTIEALEAKISVRKDDSEVLMKIVEAVRSWYNDKAGSVGTIVAINNILEHTDYGKLLKE